MVHTPLNGVRKDQIMPRTIQGQPSSRELREQIAASGKPVLVTFSRGKDSLAAWQACREAGIECHAFHLDPVPGLKFIDDSLAVYEDLFGQRIHRYPTSGFWRMLKNKVWQPPERWEIIEALRIKPMNPTRLEVQVRQDFGLPEDTLVVDGIRAADSLARYTTIKQNGMIRLGTHKFAAVGDWETKEVFGFLQDRNIPLPPDYQFWGRTLDTFNSQTLAVFRDHYPEDFQRILDWFPLADTTFLRAEMGGAA